MKKALLIMDAQKVYTDPESELYCNDSKKTIENIDRLIQQSQKDKDLIIYIKHIHKQDGSDIGRMYDYLGEAEDFGFKEGTKEVEYTENLIKSENAIEITKNRYSAFKGTDLKNILDKNNINRVVICGFMTNFCCETTAREAHDLDYYVDFIGDATGTPGTESFDEAQIRKMVGEAMENGFAKVLTTEEYLSQM